MQSVSPETHFPEIVLFFRWKEARLKIFNIILNTEKHDKYNRGH